MWKWLLIVALPLLLVGVLVYHFAPGMHPKTAAANVVSPAETQEFYAALRTFQGQLEQYRFEHNNAFPDFVNKGWTQLTTRTDAQGQPTSGGEGAVGPYLRKPIINPFTNSSEVEVANNVLAGYKPSSKFGYVLDPSTGRLFAIAGEGKLFLD